MPVTTKLEVSRPLGPERAHWPTSEASRVALMWPVGLRVSHLGQEEVHVWCARLDADLEDIHGQWEMLSSDERERAERFRFPADRRRYVRARVILRTLTGLYLGTPASAVRFRYGPFGKPSLDPRHGSDLRFNLAHSGELAVYAFTRSREVGVDVEAGTSARRRAELPDSLLAAAEREALAALPSEDRKLAALALWTRKEAYLKAQGWGLQQEPDHFEVSVPPAAPVLLRRPLGESGEGDWSLYDLCPAQDYVAALCLENNAVIRAWSWNQG